MNKEVMDWLLEDDGSGVRYPALRDLTEAGPEEINIARQQAHQSGPIAAILDKMNPEGWWENPGPGYRPKYTSTVWAVILLSQLGASAASDQRIPTACRYLLDHAMTPHGQFSVNGTPSQTADCLQGNLLAAFLAMGFDDPRLDLAVKWMAMTTTGEGVAAQNDRSTALRYYSGKIGPGFQCGANNKLPCAWGATKVMLAFSYLPIEKRTELVDRAIQTGIDFFFSVDPATAGWPCGYAEKPSGNWWKFGFPVFYITDLLQVAEALTRLGYGPDPRLKQTFDLIRNKKDKAGKWPMESNYNGKTWLEYGEKKRPNKWVTLRALRTLKEAGIPA